MPQAWQCKDCLFATKEWADFRWNSTKPASKHVGKKQRPFAGDKHGCTNPFGVHGKGFDPERKWDGVGDFVMWHLKNTDLPFDEIALQSRLKFSGKTSSNSVMWYASKLRKQGVKIPERRK